MKYLYNDVLTATEVKISDKISANLDKVGNMSISELAKLCNVSPSKITKYSKKLGFSGYKEFSYQILNDRYSTGEEKGSAFEYQKEKIEQFFDSFSDGKLEDLKALILNSEKTYMFGRGPSLKVCEYYEPRLRVSTNKNIVSNYDEYLFDLDVDHKDQQKKLMIVLTVSGKS
ncbi:MAG: MurR/RpiR family transcriptional regulator, partial [Mycoplasmatales bacterium]